MRSERPLSARLVAMGSAGILAVLLIAGGSCSGGGGSSGGASPQAQVCDLDLPAVMAGHQEPYLILVFGSLEPAVNAQIAAFLNAQPDMYAVATSADACLTAQNLSAVNVVIDYDHDGMSAERQTALAEFAANGGLLIGLHHAIWDPRRVMPVMHELYGGFLPTHCCGIDPIRVVVTDPAHPVFEGLAMTGMTHYESPHVPAGEYPYYDVPVPEEHYDQIVFLPGSDVHFLLSKEFGNSDEDSSWYRIEGQGLVFYYQLGHLPEMFDDSWYQQLIINTVRFK